MLLVLAACSSHAKGDNATREESAKKGSDAAKPSTPTPSPSPPTPTPTPTTIVAMKPGPDGVVRGPLPSDLAPRITSFLDEPVPDTVVVRFAEIARGDDPTANIRWDLDRAGRLFFVRHSDKRDAMAPFDRPLPARPSLKLDAKHVRQLFDALDDARFADHPGYEAVPGAAGGTTVIVRARKRDGAELHTVVFDAARPDLLDFLTSVTVSL